MAQAKMDFSLSPEQVADIVRAHVLNAMIDCTRNDAQVTLSSDGALVTVTRKRVRKSKAIAPKTQEASE